MNNNYTGSDKITKAFIVFREKDNKTKQKEKVFTTKTLEVGFESSFWEWAWSRMGSIIVLAERLVFGCIPWEVCNRNAQFRKPKDINGIWLLQIFSVKLIQSRVLCKRVDSTEKICKSQIPLIWLLQIFSVKSIQSRVLCKRVDLTEFLRKKCAACMAVKFRNFHNLTWKNFVKIACSLV